MAELRFSIDDYIFDFFSNTAADTASEYDSYGHRRCCTAAASSPYYSRRHHAKPVGLVLPRVLFSYSCENSFDLMTAESFAHFCRCDFRHQLESLTIPKAKRHPTRETQEHRVTSTHSASAPSAYDSFCRMCDFQGRMVLLNKRLRSNFCAAAWRGLRRGETSLPF